jgi:RNA polymerase sigma-70 factor (ECF subfamily)
LEVLNISEAELVARVLGGSQDAFRELVERYQRPVMSVIARMVHDHHLAEDLAQEVFLKVHRRLRTFDPSRKLSSWLFKIAHNTTLDHLRRKHVDTVPLETPAEDRADRADRIPDDSVPSPDTGVHRNDVAAALENAIATLRPEYREVVVLRYQEDLPYQEIVEITGLPMGTVKTHLHRARKEMVEVLRSRGWDPGEVAH